MNQILITLPILIFLVGLVLLILINKKGGQMGILMGDRIYSDTDGQPGEVLYSKTLKLVGKPDYLIKENGQIFPVEIKTGRTPNYPYQNHTMQLMAYCLLVEENYNVTPKGGYLKYPNKEFKIAYTQEAKRSLRLLVEEILKRKQTGQELFCDHPEHNE